MATGKAIHAGTRINVYNTADVEYWSSRFDSPPGRIIEAVAAVGPRPEDVRRYLRDTQRRRRPSGRTGERRREGLRKRGG
jgi:hypothetical protein